jgi:very-short-patch-repair endonuclease
MQQLVNPIWSKERHRELRRDQTEAERILWQRLSARKCANIKFRRQVGIGPYIVDFYSHEGKFVVELDGEIHNSPEAKEYDAERGAYLTGQGMTVVRFSNSQIFDSIDTVVTDIGLAFANVMRQAPPRSGGDRGG